MMYTCRSNAWVPASPAHQPRFVPACPQFAGKVAAAREAIGGSDFFLVARTDARASSAKYGLEEAIKRSGSAGGDRGGAETFTVSMQQNELWMRCGRAMASPPLGGGCGHAN